MTREYFILLSIIMISQYDDLTGKNNELQDLFRLIKEKNVKFDKFKRILKLQNNKF